MTYGEGFYFIDLLLIRIEHPLLSEKHVIHDCEYCQDYSHYHGLYHAASYLLYKEEGNDESYNTEYIVTKILHFPFTLFEYVSERCRYHCLELHRLTGYRMIEAQHIGMQTKTVDWIVAIAVFHISTDWMPHIG